MGRPATGCPQWNPTKCMWEAIVTLTNGKRHVVPLPGIAREAKDAAKLAARFASDEARAADAVPVDFKESVREWSKRWLADRELRGIASVRDNRGHLEHHILPEIGHVAIAAMTRMHIEQLVEKLDAKVRATALSWKSAQNVWASVSKMFDDAANAKSTALRVPGFENPARDVRGPDRGIRRAKQFLFPSEFLRFVECEDVPLRWRRLVALAVYLFPRDGELRALRWEDFDLEHETVHIHQSWDRRTGKIGSTKTGAARRFSVEKNVLPLLLAMRRETGTIISEKTVRTMAREFRRWLKKAGVTRTELHADTATTKAITWHDLRATGVTWMAIRGDDPLKIQHRAGHADYGTSALYIREAENVRAGFGEVFPPLPESLLHAAEVSSRYRSFVVAGIIKRGDLANSGSPLRGSNP